MHMHLPRSHGATAIDVSHPLSYFHNHYRYVRRHQPAPYSAIPLEQSAYCAQKTYQDASSLEIALSRSCTLAASANGSQALVDMTWRFHHLTISSTLYPTTLIVMFDRLSRSLLSYP